MTGLSAAATAIATASKWRSQSGSARTTIVGKLTIQLGDADRAALVVPDPLVSFDRLAADHRFVIEASELMPWTTVACVLAYGGPLRFSLEVVAGERPHMVTAAADAPVGDSMSSPVRAGFAKKLPTRGVGRLLTIPDDIDGRYFVAAPVKNQLAAIRGDEWFTFEMAGFVTRRRLPGMAVVATVRTASGERVVALTNDMVVVHGASLKISLVGRAVIYGEAELVSQAAVSLSELGGADRGDAVASRPSRDSAPRSSDGREADAPLDADDTFVIDDADLSGLSGPVTEDTRDLSKSQLERWNAASIPFPQHPIESMHEDELTSRAQPVPATPFDPGFFPGRVVPAQGLAGTLNSDESLESQMKSLRSDLRKGNARDAIGPPPEGVSRAAKNAPPTEPRPPEGPRVAPPKPGGMAKPRFKPR